MHGLIARCDGGGLANQTWEYYNAMKPDKTLVVDIDHLNGNRSNYDLYPNATFCNIHPIPDDTLRAFFKGLTSVFIAEAPYNTRFYDIAREMGVKTINQYNYEFIDWYDYPDAPFPDVLVAPSKWNYETMQAICDAKGVKHIYIHCPVNRDRLPFRQIKQARRFLHNAGKCAAQDRNGTMDLIRATKYLKTDAKVIIKFQGEQGLVHHMTMTTDDYLQYAKDYGDMSKIEFIVEDTPNYEDVYKLGDVMVLPRRYGGNCLPMNEALSCGMPVIMTDIEPNDMFLPGEWLVDTGLAGEFKARLPVQLYSAHPSALASKIDEFYNMTEDEMLAENQKADQLAESISWDVMRGEYKKLCQ